MTSGSTGALNTMKRVAPAAPGRAQEARSPQRKPAAASYTATSGEARPDPAWDALVEAAPGGDLVQTTAWAATRQRLGYRV